ncbi:MAG TPA: SOS response-associated peptidase [Actinocatenispora sp.]
MCGRYASTRSSDAIATELDASNDVEHDVLGRYNTAPSQLIRVAVHNPDTDRRSLTAAQWGFRRFRGMTAAPTNARAETAGTSRLFTTAVRGGRLVVPMDGWYEWRTTTDPDGKTIKQPHYMTPTDGTLLAAAGLYSWWHTDDDRRILTCTILTTTATGRLHDIHHRMPLLVDTDTLTAWLNPDTDPAHILTAPHIEQIAAGLHVRPVGRAVGSYRNEGPHLIDPITA